MVYSEHDLAVNVNNAMVINDQQALYDIFISEVSALLQKNKFALIRAIQESGGKISDDASQEKVADAVSEALVKNRVDVLEKIATAIFAEKQKYLNGGNMIGDIAIAVGNVAQAAATITKAALDAKTAKQQGKDAISQARLGITNQLLMGKNATDQARALADIEKQKGKASRGSVGAIVGGVIAVTVIGVIGFVLYKKTGSGGTVAVAAPTK